MHNPSLDNNKAKVYYKHMIKKIMKTKEGTQVLSHTGFLGRVFCSINLSNAQKPEAQDRSINRLSLKQYLSANMYKPC